MNRFVEAGAALMAAIAAYAVAAPAAKTVDGVGNAEPPMTLAKADEARRPKGIPDDLSGIAMCGKDGSFWAVCDSRGELCRFAVDIDPKDGKIKGCSLAEMRHVPSGKDMEGLAYDPLRDSLWICDETGPRIFEYLFREDRVGGNVDLPEHLKKCIKNRSLEAIDISPDGLSLWTCNEKAIPGDSIPGAGNAAPVRLSRLTRRSASEPWKLSEQWFYLPEARGAGVRNSDYRNGVAALCADSKGRIVILERERDDTRGLRFRMRIFEVVFPVAADAATSGSLQVLGKRLIYEEDTGTSMYEGMCIGPALKDGSGTFVLVSDGDREALESIMVLKVK